MTGFLQVLLSYGGDRGPPVWTERTAPSSKRWVAAAFGEGVFAVGGTDTTLLGPCAMYSNDNGVTWTASPTSFSALGGSGFNQGSFVFGGGQFFAGVNFTSAFYSTDGINWSAVASSPFIEHTYAFYSEVDGLFTLVSVNTNGVRVCADASDWSGSSAQTLPSNNTWSCGAALEGVRVVAANQASAYSTNGSTWSSGGNLPWSNGTRSMAAGKGTFVAVNTGSNTKVAYSVDNGVTWALSGELDGGVSHTYMDVIFADNRFLAIDQSGQGIATSLDGITWEQSPVLPAAMASFSMDLAADNLGHYVATGNSGSNTNVLASGTNV